MKHLYIILLCLPLIGFGQGNTGYISSYETLFKTTDSGNTWVEISNGPWNSVENMSFVNETTGYITQYNSYQLWKTTDSGNTWDELTFEGVPIHRMSFVDETDISTIELPIPIGKKELIKTTNILGQENTTIKNQPLIEIYDDGSTEKKIVIE